MRTTLGIILGIIVGIAVLAIVGWVLFSNFSGSRNSPTASVPVISPSPTISATPPLPITTTALPPTSVNTPTASGPAAVNFALNITSFNVSGPTSGTINAQLTNSGTAAAHNVWAKVEIFSGGSRIKIDGQDFYRKDIGTIQSGETITTQVILKINALDAPRIMQNGATFNLTINSDEKTQTFSYNYP